MAERSKALRSGRSLVLQAWVRIPLLTKLTFYMHHALSITKARKIFIRDMFSPRLELGTFRVLGERDNHYTTRTDLNNWCFLSIVNIASFVPNEIKVVNATCVFRKLYYRKKNLFPDGDRSSSLSTLLSQRPYSASRTTLCMPLGISEQCSLSCSIYQLPSIRWTIKFSFRPYTTLA